MGCEDVNNLDLPQVYSDKQLSHRDVGNWHEAGPAVVFTCDDGYETDSLNYLQYLDSRDGKKGTLFLTVGNVPELAAIGEQDPCSDWPNPITISEVDTIVEDGHEIGTHGFCHRSFTDFMYDGPPLPDPLPDPPPDPIFLDVIPGGDDDLEADLDLCLEILRTNYPDACFNTGAYPTGYHTPLIEAVVGRNHRYYRGSLTKANVGAPNPYCVACIDLQTLTNIEEGGVDVEPAKKVVHDAILTNALVVFNVHQFQEPETGSSFDWPTFRDDVLSPLIDYIDDPASDPDAALSVPVLHPVPVLTFQAAMNARVSRRGPISMEDARGQLYAPAILTNRLEIRKADNHPDSIILDYGDNTDPELDGTADPYERENKPVFSADPPSEFVFEGGLDVRGFVSTTEYLDVGGTATIHEDLAVGTTDTSVGGPEVNMRNGKIVDGMRWIVDETAPGPTKIDNPQGLTVTGPVFQVIHPLPDDMGSAPPFVLQAGPNWWDTQVRVSDGYHHRLIMNVGQLVLFDDQDPPVPRVKITENESSSGLGKIELLDAAGDEKASITSGGVLRLYDSGLDKMSTGTLVDGELTWEADP